MIECSMERFDLYPARLLGDSAYGSAEMLGCLVYEQGIEPHVTVFDKSTRQDGTFSRDDFTYDHDGDVYYRSGGKMLTTTGSLINMAVARQPLARAASARHRQRLARARVVTSQRGFRSGLSAPSTPWLVRCTTQAARAGRDAPHRILGHDPPRDKNTIAPAGNVGARARRRLPRAGFGIWRSLSMTP
jgi:hypothetical protein